MNDYYYIAVSEIESVSFSFAVHVSSDCNDFVRIWLYVERELFVRYGFKDVWFPELCEFEKYCCHPVRINLD